MGSIDVEYVEVDEYNELIQILEAAEESHRQRKLNGDGTGQDAVPQRLQKNELPLFGQTGLPDLEDIGLVCNRISRYRKTGLKVTDISASEWCQQQVAFSLSASLPKEVTETAEMVAGTHIHAGLEAETSIAIEIAVETPEDAWAARLLNMICSIRQLVTTGLTREMWIFGSIEGRWMRGIIDQIELIPEGHALIVEHKTRRNPSLPSDPQKLTAKLQAMIYRQLFEGLAAFARGPQALAMFSMLQLDAHKHLGNALVEHSQTMGLLEADTLAQLMTHLQHAARALPPATANVLVRYLWQGDGELLGEEEAVYDAAFLQQRLATHYGFWLGSQPPQQVPESERWKCRHCVFNVKCQKQG